MSDTEQPINERTRAYLHSAWVWDCEECGRENFCRGITMDLSDEEAQDVAEVFGDGQPEKFPMVSIGAPRIVTCAACGSRYESTTQREGDEEDDDEDELL